MRAKRQQSNFRKTEYQGVFYLIPKNPKEEETLYIRYRCKRCLPRCKQHNEPVGEYASTPAQAANIREDRKRGREFPNKVRKEARVTAQETNGSPMTFDRIWKTYNGVRTVSSADKSRYTKHLKEHFGHQEPSKLDPLDVDRWKKMFTDLAYEKRASGKKKLARYSKDHANSTLSLLQGLANFAKKKNLCAGLKEKIEIRGRNERTETMTDEQLAKYIKTCREWPDVQAGNFQLLIILGTGMRRGEVMNLKWENVNLEKGFLRIVQPKGGKDMNLRLSEDAITLLRNHPRLNGAEYVFTTQDGKQRSLNQVRKASRRIRDAAGLPENFRPNHGLRHSYASSLASSGEVTIHELQVLLTHKSPLTTMRYVHLSDKAMKRATSVMGRIIREAEANASGKTEEDKGGETA
jgi:integrase